MWTHCVTHWLNGACALPSLGHADGLLLHGLMYAGAIVLLDAVELVDAAQAAVRQDQGARLQMPLPSVLHCCYGQAWGGVGRNGRGEKQFNAEI